MRTAVSVPDVVFEEAKRLAKSRSRVYSEALVEYVTRHDPNSVTTRLDEVCEALGPTDDPFVSQTARKIFERVEW